MIAPAFFTSSILPKSERLVLRDGAGNKKIPLRVRVGYFHHPALGHTLIDTGYSAHVTVPGQTPDLLLSIYRRLIGPSIVSDAPLSKGLARFGVGIEQIETVIVSHFHADHAGGLLDVPGARVICSRAAWQRVNCASRVSNAMDGVFASLHPGNLETRLRFVDDSSRVTAPNGLLHGWDIVGDGSLLAIDLPGHLHGHFGLCFPRLDPPLLYAVDTQWLLQAVMNDQCPGFPASLVHHDKKAMRTSVARVKEFAARGGDVVLCHEPGINAYDADPEVGG